ncbi:MAG: hypothetical protein ABJB61_15140 [bacterium]
MPETTFAQWLTHRFGLTLKQLATALTEVLPGLGETISEAELELTDVTTANASATKHGLLKKLSDAAGDFLNGKGNWISLDTDGTLAANSDTAIASQKAVKAYVDARSEAIGLVSSDETTALTTGAAKITFRMPYAFTVTGIRSSVNTASSSGLVTVDINEGGTSILSTKLSIDANEKTSQTAATPSVISDSVLADDAEITVDIDAAGTGAKGLKVWLIGHR